MKAVGALTRLGLPALVAALPANYAIEILAQVGEPALPPLMEVLQDPDEDEEIRNVALELVIRLDGALALQAVDAALQDSAFCVSRGVLEFLDSASDTNDALPVVAAIRMLRASSLVDRRAAIEVVHR